jgi:AcrR family transcriptional regulator
MTDGRPTLRARRREEALDAIRAAAHRELVTVGAAALSLRAVAREVGMAPSALYRYFPGRDDLLTDLVVRAFDDQADAVEAAAARHRDPLAALRAGMLAYRAWGAANPERFGLLYGAPVPGYTAPPGTVRAGTRVGDLLVGLAARLHAEGRTAPPPPVDPTTRRELERLARRRGYAVPVDVLAVALDGLVRVHGVTVMEVFGQLRPLTARPAPYVARCVEAVLRDLAGDGG